MNEVHQKNSPTLSSADILSSDSVPLGQFLLRKEVWGLAKNFPCNAIGFEFNLSLILL